MIRRRVQAQLTVEAVQAVTSVKIKSERDENARQEEERAVSKSLMRATQTGEYPELLYFLTFFCVLGRRVLWGSPPSDLRCWHVCVGLYTKT